MGDENGGAKSIGESVGGLVWVRRRNGSWWPGQIVKSGELAETVAVPVRSGTAVRLLGHSETSIDWYNLEKSKRVKPFRCEEYDVYIEKAKASAGTNRKAAKYARRSDAIIEALKIENACLGREPLVFCSRVNELGSRRRKSVTKRPSMSHDSPADIHKGVKDSDSEETADSFVDLSQSCEKTNGRGIKVRPVILKRQTASDDSEDDLSKGYKRMRGLEDLGMGVVPKGKAVVGGGVGLVHRGSSSLFDSNAGNLVSNGSPVNGSRSIQSSRKRRSLVAHGHENSKRKNRSRPLTKVLENTAMVAVPETCDQLACSSSIPPQVLSDGKASEVESDGSTKLSLIKGAKISNMATLAKNHSFNSLSDTPLASEERDSAGIMEPHEVLSRQYSKSCQSEAKSLTNDMVFESGLVSSVDVDSISQRIDEGSSKWQSKGKRNSRQISKDRIYQSDKYMDIDEDDVNLAGVDLSDEFSLDLVEKVNCSGMVGSLTAHSSVKQVKSTAEYQLNGFRDYGTQISRGDSHMRGLSPMLPTPVEDSPPHQRLLPYRHSRMKVPSRYRDPESPDTNLHSNSQMFDVPVRVGLYYRSQCPLVSVTSNINGKSIIGHPLTVEILDDSDYVKTGVIESEATILSGNKNVNMDYAVKPLSEVRKFAKEHSALRQHRSNYKSVKFRKSGLHPKTRKLSSLTGRKPGEEMHLILEKCDGPALACVPVRVVFSRISDALKGPPRWTLGRNTEKVNVSQRSQDHYAGILWKQ